MERGFQVKWMELTARIGYQVRLKATSYLRGLYILLAPYHMYSMSRIVRVIGRVKTSQYDS